MLDSDFRINSPLFLVLATFLNIVAMVYVIQHSRERERALLAIIDESLKLTETPISNVSIVRINSLACQASSRIDCVAEAKEMGVVLQDIRESFGRISKKFEGFNPAEDAANTRADLMISLTRYRTLFDEFVRVNFPQIIHVVKK